MKAEEIKKQLFGQKGGFIEWLDESKIGDHFSNDVWMSFCFQLLFQQYQEFANNRKTITSIKSALNENDLKELLQLREEQRKKAEEQAKKNDKLKAIPFEDIKKEQTAKKE